MVVWGHGCFHHKINYQEQRRQRLLEHQKGKRDDLINHARALAMGDFDEEKDEEEEEEEMDTSGEVSYSL